ncbi:hypothetical protein O7608_29485 [Solwaraspora sp. WMMA2056]|uniref:hypothetical protein n=1 Tax=Solwaraspora sp. WMMA2056 TaxID=3015161 RepID=UPI00259AF200|nr:hypothetical protein [Solwaraspora sp. WMMA2056]WJK40478.1 hypothetical protein O7608_29485 [Solwaraspora sp. WMMA2056]
MRARLRELAAAGGGVLVVRHDGHPGVGRVGGSAYRDVTGVEPAADSGGGGGHVAVRPLWSCAGCGELWPCLVARVELSGVFGPVALATYAVERMTEAAFDLPDVTAAELFDRFLVWTRRPC